jgi:hypothetical protein
MKVMRSYHRRHLSDARNLLSLEVSVPQMLHEVVSISPK